ncbi:MAG: glycosyltransferase family 2 protein [Gammaproteobacteria bacterium]|nr:glycosyltransferase family 2 protein [Gammaproteobacteria bacterium]
MKKISIVTACFNEEESVEELCRRIKEVLVNLADYDYEHILIDNHSTDRTVSIIKSLAAKDMRIKLIVNARNFGAIRSGYYGFLQAQGDCVIPMAADLQDPPELIPELVKKWEEGFKVVLFVKPQSNEKWPMSAIKRYYYKFVDYISDIPLVRNATGAGLYDKRVVEILRTIDDPYPYFRGLVSEIGFPIATIPFCQPLRQHGVTKSNFYSLYDMAMLGITKHSKVPLRLLTMSGFLLSLLSVLLMVFYFFMKLIYWDSFTLGMAPILLGIFFFASVQLFFMGMLGEYIGSIHTHVRKLPLVVEIERVNFEEEAN